MALRTLPSISSRLPEARPALLLAALTALALISALASLLIPALLLLTLAILASAVAVLVVGARRERERDERLELVNALTPLTPAEHVTLEMLFEMTEEQARYLARNDPSALRARLTLTPFALARRLELSPLHALELHSGVTRKLHL